MARPWVDFTETPAKSSLSEARAKLSYALFERAFRSQMAAFEPKRSSLQGLRVYAIDGDQLELPASENILAAGYRGLL